MTNSTVPNYYAGSVTIGDYVRITHSKFYLEREKGKEKKRKDGRS